MGKIQYIIFLFLFLLTLFISGNSLAQQVPKWQWSHPSPQGQPLKWCKMWDANTWYAMGNQGTFMKTTNQGQNWFFHEDAGVKLFPGAASGDIENAYFLNMSTGICAGDYLLTKTTNGGVTFDSIPGTSTNNIWTSVYFINSSTGYAVSFNGKLIKSTDAGNTWSYISSFPVVQCYNIYSYDGIFIIGSATIGRTVLSTDAGNTWSIVNAGGSLNLYSMAFMNRDTGFVCGQSGAVKKTINGGLSWTDINNGLPGTSFSDIKIKGTNIYLTGNPDYIYKSSNFGASWDTIGFKSPSQTLTNDLYLFTDFLSDDTLLTVGISGLINTVKGGVSTCYTNYVRPGGFNTAYVMNAVWAESPFGKVWAVGAPSSLGFDQILYSSNGGSVWSIQPLQISATLNSISMLNSSTGYAGGTSGTVIKTTNGINWTNINYPASGTINRIQFVNVTTGWTFGQASIIYKTTDGGASWTQQNSGFGSDINGASMINDLTGWCVGSLQGAGRIAKTTNGGDNWITQTTPTNNPILDIKMLDANTGYIGGAQILAKTTNGGVNWTLLTVPFPTYFVQSLDFFNAQNGVVTLNYEYSLRTTDGGNSWIMNTLPGISGLINKIFMVSENYAYNVGFGASVYKYDAHIDGIIQWNNNIPKKYELHQNYPNPFNPSTVIEFAIPKAAEITLKIFDVSGRVVKEIFNNQNLNPGTYKYNFDGNNLSSGVYFYSLAEDGMIVSTKKMVFVK